MKKHLLFIVLALYLLIPIATADVTIVNDIYFPDSNITIAAIQNATNFTTYNSTDTPTNTLEMYINGSKIWLASDANVTISNITFIENVWNFSAVGTGNLNITYTFNESTTYDFYVNDTLNDSKQSESRNVNFPYPVSGGGDFSGRNSTPPVISIKNESVAPASISQGNSVTISTHVVCTNCDLTAVKVKVLSPASGGTYGVGDDGLGNWTMISGGGTLWYYTYRQTSDVGTYQINDYYITSNNATALHDQSLLSFTVAQSVGGAGGGGGGGGGTTVITVTPTPEPTPFVPSINLMSLANDPLGKTAFQLLFAFGFIMLIFFFLKKNSKVSTLIGGVLLMGVSYGVLGESLFSGWFIWLI